MLILPATNFSSKQPPKVTFMLPAYLPNSNNGKSRFLLISAKIYQFKVSNRNTRKRCEVCSKLAVETSTTTMTSLWCFYH